MLIFISKPSQHDSASCVLPASNFCPLSRHMLFTLEVKWTGLLNCSRAMSCEEEILTPLEVFLDTMSHSGCKYTFFIAISCSHPSGLSMLCTPTWTCHQKGKFCNHLMIHLIFSQCSRKLGLMAEWWYKTVHVTTTLACHLRSQKIWMKSEMPFAICFLTLLKLALDVSFESETSPLAGVARIGNGNPIHRHPCDRFHRHTPFNSYLVFTPSNKTVYFPLLNES